MKNDKVVYGWFDGEECFYIGIGSKNRSKRLSQRNRYCSNKQQKAKRQGTFHIEVMYSCLTFEEACEIERQLIQQYGRLDLGTGCLTNMTDGGEGMPNPSMKTRERISQSMSGENHRLFGKSLPSEVKEKISQSQTGKTYGMETRKKLRNKKKGNKNPMFGKKHNLESIDKMTGKNNPHSIPVMTSEGQFDSAQLAAKSVGCSSSTISRRCDNPNFPEYYYL